MRSLRVRLILLLGIAIAAVAALQFATSFHEAMQQANKLFDYHMQQMALALQDSSFEQNQWRTFSTSNNETFEFAIQVWTDDGVQSYESRKFKALPPQGKLGYSTVTLENGDWRIYAVETQSRQIQVAQRMEARRDRAIRLAWHSLWPVLAASMLLFGITWWVVTAALSPLNRIGRELANRNADSLAPISDAGVPMEVLPLVSELNLLLARVAQALEAQQRFVADAAHELRTPLTALKLQVQTLARTKDETARTQAVGRLLGGVDRASRLVEQLLTLARQDPLSHAPQVGPVSLSCCIEEAVNDLQPFAQSRHIDLRYDNAAEQMEDQYAAQSEQIEVTGDAESIKMMLRNLLDNAIRYSSEHGRVEARLQADGDAAMVTVEDSGPGIPEQDRARIFDRFYRVPGTVQNGSGLGLSIVKAIADRHKTSIELGNSNMGGLAVKLRFPLLRS